MHNLHDTIQERIRACETYVLNTKDETNAETRGMRALMQDKMRNLLRLSAEWDRRFGHWEERAIFDDAVDILGEDGDDASDAEDGDDGQEGDTN